MSTHYIPETQDAAGFTKTICGMVVTSDLNVVGPPAVAKVSCPICLTALKRAEESGQEKTDTPEEPMRDVTTWLKDFTDRILAGGGPPMPLGWLTDADGPEVDDQPRPDQIDPEPDDDGYMAVTRHQDFQGVTLWLGDEFPVTVDDLMSPESLRDLIDSGHQRHLAIRRLHRIIDMLSVED